MAWFSLAQIKATPWSGTVGGSVKRSLAMALFGHAKPNAKAFGLDAATRPCCKQCYPVLDLARQIGFVWRQAAAKIPAQSACDPEQG